MRRISAYSVMAVALVVLSLGTFARPVPAQENGDGDEGFSAYSVARMKIFEGTAWVRLPDSGEWEEYSTNSPVPERARINIPEKSEAELQFHGGQFVLLTSGTEVDVRKFDEESSVFRLRSGEIRFDLPADDFSPVRIVLPGDRKVNFPAPGRYWLTALEGGKTRLVVRTGEAAVTVPRGEFRVNAGQEATIGEEVRIAAYSGPGDDKGYRPPELTGEESESGVPPAAAEELRDYGEWIDTPDYGYAWRPRVVVGWSPYFYGRWVWISPFGWTWVSYEPWGWYPYHYGWWADDPVFGWIWCPYRSFVSVNFTFGHSRVRHFHRGTYFYPGTVRFVRNGGNVRWIPVRPGERIVRPSFTRTDTRLSRWERPLERNRVFVRMGGVRGKGEWRDWSVVRKERRDVVVRPRGEHVGQPPSRVVAPRREGGAGSRGPAERIRPENRSRAKERERYDRRPGGPDVLPERPNRTAPDYGVRERRAPAEPNRSEPGNRVERVRPERPRVEPGFREERVAPPPPRQKMEREGPGYRIETPPPRSFERREEPVRQGGPSSDFEQGGRDRSDMGSRGERGERGR